MRQMIAATAAGVRAEKSRVPPQPPVTTGALRSQFYQSAADALSDAIDLIIIVTGRGDSLVDGSTVG